MLKLLFFSFSIVLDSHRTLNESMNQSIKVDDLLELPACNELVDGVESDRDADSTDEESLTPSRREQRPRKRLKPWRYRDDVP